MNVIVSLLLLSLNFLLVRPASTAEYYKCIDETGNISISNVVCPENSRDRDAEERIREAKEKERSKNEGMSQEQIAKPKWGDDLLKENEISLYNIHLRLFDLHLATFTRGWERTSFIRNECWNEQKRFDQAIKKGEAKLAEMISDRLLNLRLTFLEECRGL